MVVLVTTDKGDSFQFPHVTYEKDMKFLVEVMAGVYDDAKVTSMNLRAS